MGQDKALLPWRSGVILDHMIAVGHDLAGSTRTFVVGDRPQYHGRGAQVVADLYSGCGPLGGIATALRLASTQRVFILAVDMPLVSRSLLKAMATYSTTADVLVPEVVVQSAYDPPSLKLHVLHAIYRKSCLDVALKRLGQNDLRVTSLFDDVEVETLGESWLRKYDPELRSFENVNYPEDYARLRFGS